MALLQPRCKISIHFTNVHTVHSSIFRSLILEAVDVAKGATPAISSTSSWGAPNILLVLDLPLGLLSCQSCWEGLQKEAARRQTYLALTSPHLTSLNETKRWPIQRLSQISELLILLCTLRQVTLWKSHLALLCDLILSVTSRSESLPRRVETNLTGKHQALIFI